MIRKLLLSASLLGAAWPGVASATWQVASSPHFIVYADDKPERVRAFTEKLERFDKALRLIRPVSELPPTDAERVRVYMVGDVSDVQRLGGKGFEGVAGFYSTRVGGPVAFVPRDAGDTSEYDLGAQAILFHEYTHHWMFLNYPSVVFPAWYVEGFAEFNGTARVDKDGAVKLGYFPTYRAGSVIDPGLLPAARLIQLDPGKMRDDQRDALYSRGWLLMHMLTFEPSRKGQIEQYLTAINAGKSATEAGKVFGDLKKLDADMTNYIMRPKITILSIPAAKLTIGAVTLRALSAGEAAVMPALLRSTRGVDKAGAQSVVTLARKLAAPYPNDAGAQNELAEAEYDAGNLDAADAAADRALAADPKSIHALIYKGMIKSAKLQAAGDKAVDQWRVAQGWFLKANKVDPDNPLPLMLFYRAFIDGGRAPTANAEDGLIAAYQLAPFDYSLRMNAAAILLRRKDIVRARNALLPVAYSPHRAGIAALALDAVTAIDAGNLDAAQRLLDGSGGHDDKAADKLRLR